MVADRHDGCVAQLQDSDHLATHDSQRPPGHESRTPEHILQEALGHCGGHHGKTVTEGGREEGEDGGEQGLPGLSAGCCGATS